MSIHFRSPTHKLPPLALRGRIGVPILSTPWLSLIRPTLLKNFYRFSEIVQVEICNRCSLVSAPLNSLQLNRSVLFGQSLVSWGWTLHSRSAQLRPSRSATYPYFTQEPEQFPCCLLSHHKNGYS